MKISLGTDHAGFHYKEKVKAALPGIKPEEVEVSINKDVLTIKAEHKTESEDTKAALEEENK